MTTESYSLPVSLLRQWAYCPRIVFFREAMRIAASEPFHVMQGIEAHRRYAMLERRRGLSRFGLEGFRKAFSVPMKSERLGIHGIVDGILVGEESIHVIEFKPDSRHVPAGHLFQTMGYGMLAEEHYAMPLAGLHILHGEKGHTVSVTGERLEVLRWKTLDAISHARKIVGEAFMPTSPAADSKCAQCEYLNFCGDRDVKVELQ